MMGKFFAAVAIMMLATISSFSQTDIKSAGPSFDPELAKKLGADKMGMRNYILAILKTGPKDAEIKGEARSEMFKGHFSNMTRLANEGMLSVAGPFGKNDKTFRGLFILNVKTVEEAQKLVETDPTIKAGIFVVDLVPWYGSAGLMEVNRIHAKISQENP